MLKGCKLNISSSWEDSHSSLAAFNLRRFDSLPSEQKALVLILFCLQENELFNEAKQSALKLWVLLLLCLKEDSDGKYLISRYIEL